ncbi:hypothetical protein ZTR_07468 [Talaromyces verruculosus]|nr:hypothetical protein ZTR_07468 [Talaromyces verruculosus]
MSRLKRHNERKSGSPTKGMSGLEKDTSQETVDSFALSHTSTSSRSSFAMETPQRDSSPPRPEHLSEAKPLVRRRSTNNPYTEPIFLGVDFGALLRIRGGIAAQETLWIDLWQHFAPGKKVVPLDDQYLSCLTSFKNLRCLKVSGMLKSYQKKLFQAIWQMERLEDLQLRMAEEPRLSPEAELRFHPIEEGWSPQTKDAQSHVSSGEKGRIFKQYGDAEYLDNCVIELAKPNLKSNHPEYNTWMDRLLPIVHLTLRGFVVDAVPFCSCFDADKLRSITFTDCYDAGFYLPNNMEHVKLYFGSNDKHKAIEGRRVSTDQEVKRLTYMDGKKIGESPFVSSSSSQDDAGRSGYDKKQGSPSSIPRYTASSLPTSSYSSSILSGQGLRKPRLPLEYRKRVVSSVIEEDEGEE